MTVALVLYLIEISDGGHPDRSLRFKYTEKVLVKASLVQLKNNEMKITVISKD